MIGDTLLNLILSIPKTLYEGLKSIFSSLGGYISNMMHFQCNWIDDGIVDYIGLPTK